MSQTSKKTALGTLFALLLGAVVAKGVWSAVSYLYLPKKGIDVSRGAAIRPLYYHYNLASKKDAPKQIVHKNPKPAVRVPVVQPKPKPEIINSFLFKGLYNSRDKKIIVVEYLGQTAVLKIGDSYQRYRFKALHGKVAVFEKDGKEYKLVYQADPNAKKQKENSTNSNSTPAVSPKPQAQKKVQQNQSRAIAVTPYKDGETTVIPKDLFDRFRRSPRDIQRNINAVPHMENGHLNGFKVNYIKKGSDFAKLGIQKGDIITAVNGEPLDNLRVPIEFFRKLNTIQAATFTIQRGNETKELEYEVR